MDCKASTMDSALVVLLILAISVLVVWQLGHVAGFRETRIVRGDLGVFEAAVNLACLYDHMNISGVQLESIDANMTVSSSVVCITPDSSPTICRHLLCPSMSEEIFYLGDFDRFDIIRNNSGFKVKNV